MVSNLNLGLLTKTEISLDQSPHNFMKTSTNENVWFRLKKRNIIEGGSSSLSDQRKMDYICMKFNLTLDSNTAFSP